MPYREPIFFEGGYYHIYTRGSEKRNIFIDRADRERFLNRLKEYKDRHRVSVLCYCLMPNHYHLLVKQLSSESISKFISRLNLAYAMYFNKRYERVGPLFQGRFKAKNVDKDEYIVHLSRYIHLNSLAVNSDFENYPWSSISYYLKRNDVDFIDTSMILSYFSRKDASADYLNFMREEDNKKLKMKIEDLILEEISPVQVRVLKRGNE